MNKIIYKKKIKLISDRIVLRPLNNNDDIKRYYYWLKDSTVTEFLEVRHLKMSKNKIKNFVHKQYISPNNILFGIFVRDTNEHIGNIKIGPINFIYLRTELGIIIGEKKFWKKGFASESIKMVENYCFNILKLNRITASICSPNIASINTFKKCNYKIEGILKKYWVINQKFADEIIMAKYNEL